MSALNPVPTLIMAELSQIAFSNASDVLEGLKKDIPDSSLKQIKSYSKNQNGFSFSMYDKLKAIEMLINLLAINDSDKLNQDDSRNNLLERVRKILENNVAKQEAAKDIFEKTWI